MILLDNLQKVRDEVAMYDRKINLVAACKMQTKDTIDKFMSIAPDFVLGENRVQEFVWAFGAESEEQIEKQIKLQIEQLKKTKDIEEIMHGRWAHMDEFDQDEWLEHLEEHLKEIVNISGKDVHTLAADIEMHRREVHERIAREHPELAERFAQRRHLLDKHLKERRPEVYRIIVQLREGNKHK